MCTCALHTYRAPHTHTHRTLLFCTFSWWTYNLLFLVHAPQLALIVAVFALARHYPELFVSLWLYGVLPTTSIYVSCVPFERFNVYAALAVLSQSAYTHHLCATSNIYRTDIRIRTTCVRVYVFT